MAIAHGVLTLCAAATCACKPDPGPDLQILGESARLRIGDPLPRSSPYFDGTRVSLVAARGETIGIQVWHRDAGAVTLALPGARVESYAVDALHVVRPSSDLYGGSHGAGDYPDALRAMDAPATNPAYFEITADATAFGDLVVAGRRVPVAVTILPVRLPPLPVGVWAYYRAEVLGGTNEAPSAAERACIAMFRARGVLLSPDLPPSAWPARRELIGDAPYIPAVIAADPAGAQRDVRAWLDQTGRGDEVPFAIPIDEPHTASQRVAVAELANAARIAEAGKHDFLFAVTDDPDPLYLDRVDLYITLRAKLADRFLRWTYNGAPPHAGSMVLDAEAPGLRTWGWIAWRWKIPLWYAWDALYWVDRHNHHDRQLDAARDATSFDNGEDHGNLDGVLALPGCQPTLRLAALRRGQEDRALLQLASHCAPDATTKLAERMVPRALGDAPDRGAPAWPLDEAAWEAARRQLLDLAAPCSR